MSGAVVQPHVPHGVAEVSFEEGAQVMLREDYDGDQFVPAWNTWLARGDVVLIFENQDMGHHALGHVITMPWNPAHELPQQAPDHPAIGLGWRYRLRYLIRSR